MENFIFLLFFTELLFIAISFWMTRGNLLSPSLITYIVFAIATLFVIYNNEMWDVHYSFRAWYITSVGFFIMLLPEIIFLFISRKNVNCAQMNYRKEFNEIDNVLNFFISVISLILLGIYIFEVFRRGNSLGASGWDIIGKVKYDTETTGTVFEKASYKLLMIIYFAYAYIITDNIVIKKVRFTNSIKYFCPMICYLVAVFFAGNRAGLIRAFIAVYVCLMSLLLETNSIKQFGFKKIIIRVISVGGIFTIAFYMLRAITKVNTTTTNMKFINYISLYMGGPVYLFSKYLDDPSSVHGTNVYFGEQTLTSILMNFGLKPPYENKFLLIGGRSNLATNVYSWFQSPINDYGVIGMFAFTFVIYAFFDLLLYFGILRYKSKLATVMMMFYYFVVVMSFYYCQVMWACSLMNLIYIGCITLLIEYIPRIKLKVV